MIGDCRSAALVARDGSIDWLCWPRFDSNACLAALLGTPENGRFHIAPAGGGRAQSRCYRDSTMILESVFAGEQGEVVMIDFMVPMVPFGTLVRIVEGRSGSVDMRMELALRFDFGQSIPWVTKRQGGNGIVAISGPDMVVLRTNVALRGEDMTTVGDFRVQAGERVAFVLTYCASHLEVPLTYDPADALYQTEAFWRKWSARSTYSGEWGDYVQRSLLTL
jgi:GH15 family glucan-1,4-alpha-glucosidase